ncbi:hypothetical protein FAM09_07620 [Niastella caeni]|uniref:DUF481 domain-containing protein n=1 Tax=Niastella caeni TaxID=2569763 RepID=A0A4S8I2C3_9BACT|nr:hypothetical protein [Niastella caeni]THU41961.1 hypothetical protein FAM09_07620 [Niastella caeni]
MKKVIALFPLAIVSMALQAQQQTDSTSTAPKKKITFTAGVSYNSTLNYYGRTDSLKSQGIYPFVGITLPNGLYVFSNFIFINNAVATSYAATTVEAGYKFKNKKETWKGNIFGSRFFYNADVSLVQSVVKGQAGINLSNKNKVVAIYGGADAKFSNQTDFGAYAGLDHAFRFDSVGKKGVIVIAPAVFGYFGTQRFSKTWLQEKRFLIFPVSQETVTQSSSRFSIMSYELSCPVVYGIGKMNLIFTPAYVIPQNVVTADGTSSQKAENLFYATATVRFDF